MWPFNCFVLMVLMRLINHPVLFCTELLVSRLVFDVAALFVRWMLARLINPGRYLSGLQRQKTQSVAVVLLARSCNGNAASTLELAAFKLH